MAVLRLGIENNIFKVGQYWTSDPVTTTLFRTRIKLKLNILLLWTFFETYYHFLTIDLLFIIIYKQAFSEF